MLVCHKLYRVAAGVIHPFYHVAVACGGSRHFIGRCCGSTIAPNQTLETLLNLLGLHTQDVPQQLSAQNAVEPLHRFGKTINFISGVIEKERCSHCSGYPEMTHQRLGTVKSSTNCDTLLIQ